MAAHDRAATGLQHAIIQTLRREGPQSRADLARRLGVNRNNLADPLAALTAAGFVHEPNLAASTGGRKARLVELNARAGFIAAVDLGATSLDAAVTDLQLHILAERSEPVDVAQGPTLMLERATQMVRALLADLGLTPDRLLGVGMGVPGPVDYRLGRTVSPPIMPGWNQFPIKDHLAEAFGCPAYVDNDVNIMALGEQFAGLGRGAESFIFVKLGTGIGAGIVLGGRIYRGSDGCAGDIGHMAVDGSDVLCRCGNVGCLEALAGGPGIARRARLAAEAGRAPRVASFLQEHDELTSVDVGHLAAQGDPGAVEVIRETGRLVGRVMASLVNVLNPSLVVIGGGVAQIGDVLLASIREAVYRRSLPLATRHLRIERSAVEPRAGVLGAAVMALDEVLSAEGLERSLRA
ncbi:ROK family transcriptional regulator [Limnochorda pilosa]|uniref:ROK family transcriptional regulator n=1 Tax=Limnochorda pilosa TaxID=1555112 RepID=A0A0K2SKY6_LIMPI|nr:ROK family transcriptional regulator [Limnochorda pilosa]